MSPSAICSSTEKCKSETPTAYLAEHLSILPGRGLDPETEPDLQRPPRQTARWSQSFPRLMPSSMKRLTTTQLGFVGWFILNERAFFEIVPCGFPGGWWQPGQTPFSSSVRIGGKDVGPGIGCSLFVGQRTFETRSLYLILAEKLFTLPAANEMLPLSALFAGKYREVLVLYLKRPSRAAHDEPFACGRSRYTTKTSQG